MSVFFLVFLLTNTHFLGDSVVFILYVFVAVCLFKKKEVMVRAWSRRVDIDERAKYSVYFLLKLYAHWPQ